MPSIGSIAMSNCGEPGIQVPSCSPLKIPGASSLIPSPITTSPQMFIRSNMPRMASQAAASALPCRRVQPAQRIQCSRFGRANKIELDDPLDVPIILFWQSQSHGASIFTHVVRDDKENAARRECSLMLREFFILWNRESPEG